MHRNDLLPSDFEPVTLSDSAEVNYCGLRVAVAGNVAVRTGKGNDRVYPAQAGEVIFCHITKVKLTGTTVAAGNIIGYIA